MQTAADLVQRPQPVHATCVVDQSRLISGNACIAGYGQKELSSPFDYAGPLTETILMGNLALRSYNIKDANGKFPGRKKLLWDAVNMKITNFDEANQFVKREYRQGWKLGL